jgi:DNA-binding response OmpR family regulator
VHNPENGPPAFILGREEHFFRDRSLLVVDDEPYNVDILVFELEDRGFTVHTALDGQAALELLEGGLRPDLILLDVTMPRLDGFGLTRAIRAHPDLAHLPVILLTARAELEDKAEGFAARADDYVLKPFHIDEVLARVQVQLRISGYLRLRRQVAESHSRLALVGAAAHELAQPLAGANGYLQLLQAAVERGNVGAEAHAERLERIEHCLLKTRDVAQRLESLERVALEDYPCGTQIINLQESQVPEAVRNAEDPNHTILILEAGVTRDTGLEAELTRQGARVVRMEELAGQEAEVDVILLSAVDRSDVVGPIVQATLKAWEAPHLLGPPVLALLPGQQGVTGVGVGLLRLGVDDVLCRPFRQEELLLRLRSRVRLQRLRMEDLRTQSLDAARDMRHRALEGFGDQVEKCLEELPSLGCGGDDLAGRLATYSRRLEALNAVVRRLQSRQMAGGEPLR